MNTLSYERIGHSSPSQWIFIVHGFLGRGANWRTFARNLVKQKPDWGAVLIDLRMHGASQNFTDPHTIAAAAEDLVRLCEEFSEPIGGVLGHSFGAKVALKFVEIAPEKLHVAWIVDAVPWALNTTHASSTYTVLNILEPLTYETFLSRKNFIAKLEHAGLDRATSQWLAMNLHDSGQSLKLLLQPLALKKLLDDYFKQDLVYILLDNKINTHIYFALGSKSKLLSNNDRQRIINIPAQTFILEDAGHDVHIDAHDKLLELVLTSFGNNS